MCVESHKTPNAREMAMFILEMQNDLEDRLCKSAGTHCQVTYATRAEQCNEILRFITGLTRSATWFDFKRAIDHQFPE